MTETAEKTRMGAVLANLENEYGTPFGEIAYCFPCCANDWFKFALPCAINKAIENKYNAIRFALSCRVLPEWDSWETYCGGETETGDVWNQHRTEICTSLEEAIKKAIGE